MRNQHTLRRLTHSPALHLHPVFQFCCSGTFPVVWNQPGSRNTTHLKKNMCILLCWVPLIYLLLQKTSSKPWHFLHLSQTSYALGLMCVWNIVSCSVCCSIELQLQLFVTMSQSQTVYGHNTQTSSCVIWHSEKLLIRNKNMKLWLMIK